MSLLTLVPDAPSVALIVPAGINGSSSAHEIPFSSLRKMVLQFRDIMRTRLGVQKGQVIAMSNPNSVEFVVGFIGTGASRAVSAPLNPSYSSNEVEFYLGDTKPVLLLLPRGGNDQALKAANSIGVRTAEFWIDRAGNVNVQVVFEGKKRSASSSGGVGGDPQPDDVALVLHTSGTTGRPKSVPLTHHNLLITSQNIVNTYWLTPADRSYLVMPLFHVHGLLAGLLAPLRSGGSVVIPDKFSANRFWKDFASTNCTWYTAVPTIHSILLNSPIPSPLPKIRFIRSCSSSLSPTVFHKLEQTFKAPVLEAYAMTEAAHQMTSNDFLARTPGTVGMGQGVEISIRDDKGKELPTGERGEVCVRGQNVTKGYWENEKANKESFWEGRWFRTGDQGILRKEFPHPLELTGRLKELINRGGEKISPLEVDSALLAVDGVKEAVCFGVEDEHYGEIVWAAVVLSAAGSQDSEESRIRHALDGKISKFKIPQRVTIVQEIPKGPTGKISRKNVKEVLVKKHGKTKAKL
ncbi:hypothetical protein FRB93_012327 [Tulasnella sp. JGI-2019a]|nr:hypothetical protein FRB93_012327 [Tulasnella sp. JGI-2019a]